jgi:transcriptional regulator of NAD metabolism
MGILDELHPTKTHHAIINEFLDAQTKKDREEWLEALRRADIYSTRSILDLMISKGLQGVNENGLTRYRRKLEGYASAR